MAEAVASNVIAFQGAQGAYSDMACRAVHPEMTTLACASFEDTFAAVQDGRAKYAMTPIENSVAGRVADIHRLMPDSGLHITAEHFMRVNHHLLAPEGATRKSIRIVRSHVHALSQCRRMIRKLGLRQTFPTFEGDLMRFSAKAIEKSINESEPWIVCELIGKNQEDRQILTGRCTLMLSARS